MSQPPTHQYMQQSGWNRGGDVFGVGPVTFTATEAWGLPKDSDGNDVLEYDEHGNLITVPLTTVVVVFDAPENAEMGSTPPDEPIEWPEEHQAVILAPGESIAVPEGKWASVLYFYEGTFVDMSTPPTDPTDPDDPGPTDPDDPGPTDPDDPGPTDPDDPGPTDPEDPDPTTPDPDEDESDPPWWDLSEQIDDFQDALEDFGRGVYNLVNIELPAAVCAVPGAISPALPPWAKPAAYVLTMLPANWWAHNVTWDGPYHDGGCPTLVG
ncbi:hypothetical protein [Gordonia iterans]